MPIREILRRTLVATSIALAAGCSASTARKAVSDQASAHNVPEWMHGVWSREWIERRGARSSPFIVRYFQTPTVFGDVRLPVDRPAFQRAASFADLSDADLMILARQRGFVGVTTADGDRATWHHEIDFQPPDTSADIGRIEHQGPGRMFEHALDGSYTEFWWSLTSGDQRFLVVRVKRADRLERVLLVVGDQFYYARNRARDLAPAENLEQLIQSAHATREQVIRFLDCELSVGQVRGGATPWQIQFSTLPWRQGQHLEFVDRIGRDLQGGLAPRSEPGEQWDVPVNTLSLQALDDLFGQSR
ncbi:MAG: hypothetical protein U0132_03945 [Gemmatimonadaceae bacterium]